MRLILALLCISLSLFAKDINIASYNVENLFDGVNQGSEYRDFTLSHKGWNKKMANIKFKHTLKAIKSINADIIALQEVENEALLGALAKGAGFEYLAFTKPIKSPVGVGILSKYPIVFKESIYAGIRKTRDFLHVKIDIDGKKLGIWVVHFPTQKYPFSKRMKVAKTLKKAIEKSGDGEFLMVGDFNTKISPKSILQKTFGPLKQKKDFYDPWFSLPYHSRYSQVFYGKKSALDRMIMGKRLFDGKGLEYKINSFKVVKNSFLKDKKGYPNRWKKRKGYHQGRGYSDHFPIMLSISDKPNKPILKHVQKTTNIKNLYKMDTGDVNVKLSKVVVVYKNKHGVIINQNGRGIYVYKPDFDLKKFHMYDFWVKSIKDYKGLREIDLLGVEKEYGKVQNISDYFIKASHIQDAKPSDVVDKISGIVKGRYLMGDFGKIMLFVKDGKKLKNNQSLDLKEVRVGKYKGKLELILEDRE